MKRNEIAKVLRQPLSAGMGAANLFFILGVTLLWVAASWMWLITPSGWPLLGASFLYVLVQWIHRKSLSEWLHEGAHFNVLPGRSWNDRLLNTVAGSLFFEEISHHRFRHFAHHRVEGYFRETDPDTSPLDIRTRGDLGRAILQDLTGVTALRAVSAPPQLKVPATVLRRNMQFQIVSLIGHGIVLAALTAIFGPRGLALFALHFAFLLTLYPLFNRIRVYSQHIEIGSDGESRILGSRTSRTVFTQGIDRIFLHSRVMMFHWEHHHYSTLHFRQLEQICTYDETDPNRYTVGRRATLARLFRGLPKTVPFCPTKQLASVLPR